MHWKAHGRVLADAPTTGHTSTSPESSWTLINLPEGAGPCLDLVAVTDGVLVLAAEEQMFQGTRIRTRGPGYGRG